MPVLACFAAPAHAVIIGAGTSSNSFPFGDVGAGFAGTRYQQVYNDASFGGPITISTIRFFLALGDTLATGTYTISLSHSANPVDALNTTDFNANVGADNTLFGVFTIGGAAGPTLDFVGTPFVYDGVGDLLVDIQSTITTLGNAFYRADNGNAGGAYSRAHNFGVEFNGWGLQTEFVAGTAAVSLPSTLLLMAVGLLGFGVPSRRAR